MTSPTLVRTLRAGAVGLLVAALVACAPQDAATDQDAPPAQAPAASHGAVNGAGNSTDPTGTQTGQGTADTDARWYELMHVQQTASPCALVWAVGNVLPADYQWCADQNNQPVAGVRVGPCEVVTHNRTMYAVPGRTIAGVVGTLDRDPTYLDLLTACKRTPHSSATDIKEDR